MKKAGNTGGSEGRIGRKKKPREGNERHKGKHTNQQAKREGAG